MIQPKTIAKTNAIIKPSGTLKVCVSKMPTITGRIMSAPSALVFGKMTNKPPTISATATNGNNHVIAAAWPNNSAAPSCIFSGMGI